MNNPRVSICLPTYNGREHLAECVASIRAQTFAGFEVVICDDESTDGTLDLARQMAAGDARFRFIANPRRLGLVGNWNQCLQQARGEWIKFVFQDDLIEPRCLERLVTAAEQRGQRFAFCRRRILFHEGTAAELRGFLESHAAFLSRVYGPADSYVDAAAFARLTVQHPRMNLVGEPTVTLFHRSLIQELGLFTPAMIQTCDSEYWTRLATNVGVVQVAETLAAFRVHARSTTSRNLAEKQFVLDYLDPLVANYFYLYGRNYATLRREFFHSPGRLASWWQLACLAHDTKTMARSLPDGRNLQKEWSAAVQACPHLNTLARLGCLFRLIRYGRTRVQRQPQTAAQ